MKVRSYRGFFAAVGGLLLIFAAVSAQAQDSTGRRNFRGMGGGMGMGMDPVRLLGLEQVQKELQVTDEQKTKIEKFLEKLREEGRARMQGMGNLREEMEKLSQEEREKKFESLMKQRMEEQAKRAQENMVKLAEILNVEQLKRVKQIQYQLEGVAVLLRSEVRKQIGLDDAQEQQLQKIADDARGKMREFMPRFGGRNGNGDQSGDRDAMQKIREKMEEFRAQVEKDSMAVLNAEQKQKLAELMGKPFELDRSAFGRRDGGRNGDNAQGGNRRNGNRGNRNRQGGESRDN
jgi:Spy/CpxP family protein refolding chaperone